MAETIELFPAKLCAYCKTAEIAEGQIDCPSCGYPQRGSYIEKDEYLRLINKNKASYFEIETLAGEWVVYWFSLAILAFLWSANLINKSKGGISQFTLSNAPIIINLAYALLLSANYALSNFFHSNTPFAFAGFAIWFIGQISLYVFDWLFVSSAYGLHVLADIIAAFFDLIILLFWYRAYSKIKNYRTIEAELFRNPKIKKMVMDEMNR